MSLVCLFVCVCVRTVCLATAPQFETWSLRPRSSTLACASMCQDISVLAVAAWKPRSPGCLGCLSVEKDHCTREGRSILVSGPVTELP